MRPQILKQVLTTSGVMAAGRGVCDRCCGVNGVLTPYQPLHLLVEHAIQRLEERSQPAWDQDDDSFCSPQEVGDDFVSVAPEVIQHQDAWALLDDASVVGAKLPALREPKGVLPRVPPAFLLHAIRHAPRGVPELGAVPRGNLCRDGVISRLEPLALPRRGRRDKRRALEDNAQRNLAAFSHDSKTESEVIFFFACGGINTRREGGKGGGEFNFRETKLD